jgi:hypothetical protein
LRHRALRRIIGWLLDGKEILMVQLLMLMLLAAQQGPGPGSGDRMVIRERVQAPTPVTDLFLLPPKIPDCRNDQQIEQALAEKANGDRQSCDPPRSVQRH